MPTVNENINRLTEVSIEECARICAHKQISLETFKSSQANYECYTTSNLQSTRYDVVSLCEALWVHTSAL